MNSEQIKLFKDSYSVEATKPNGKCSTLSEYIRFCLDGNVEMVTSKDCVVYDDTNSLLHCICRNDDAKSQADFPVKVISADFSMVQQVEGIMSIENFEKLLNNGFLAEVTSDEQKAFLLAFAKHYKVHALQPMDADPYYAFNPELSPMHNNVITNPAASGSTSIANPVSNTAAMKKAIANGASAVTITSDMTLTAEDAFIIEDGKELTIDLNGKKLTTEADCAFKVTKGALKIVNNGKEPAILHSNGRAFRVDGKVGENPSLEIGKGVTVISDTECCIFAVGKSKVVCAGDLEAYGPFAPISGNGNAGNEGTEIIINGGSIRTSVDTGIYQPQNGKLTINDCDIEVNGTVVYAKCGEIVINGGRFVATGEKRAYSYNGNGTDVTGDAVVIDCCDYPGGMPTVVINGGEFISANALGLGVYDKAGTSDPDIAQVSVKGGKFTGEVNAKYLAEGVTCALDEESGMYVVA